jgi:glycosyltransferase involved in cell wall biosynthesis
MSVLMIVEPHSSGHRMQYVHWIVRGALEEGFSVQLVTFPESLDHPLYLAMQEECQGRVRVALLPERGILQKENLLNRPGILNLVERELTYYRLYSAFFRQLSSSERPSFVFLPYLDYCTYAVAVLGSPFGDIPWGGIVMRPSFHLGPMGIESSRSRLHWPKERLFFRLLRNRTLRVLFSIDEPLVHYVRRSKPRLAERLQFLPDPAEFSGTSSRESARRMLEIPGDAVIVLVYGSLTPRKGIDALLRATQESTFPQEVHILLAGRQDAEVQELLLSSHAEALREAGRLHEHNEFLSDDDQYSVFRVADIVWLGYRGHYAMSGVLVQAAMMGLPVVACADGLVGWMTRRHELGLTVAIDDAEAVAQVIAKLVRSAEAIAEYGDNGKCFSSLHTSEHFARAIMAKLQAGSIP